MKLSREMNLEEARAAVVRLRRENLQYINALEDVESALRAWEKWAWDNASWIQRLDLYAKNLVPEHFTKRG